MGMGEQVKSSILKMLNLRYATGAVKCVCESQIQGRDLKL